MVVTDFADDGHAARAEDIVKDADSRNLRLGDRQTLIALNDGAGGNGYAENSSGHVATGVQRRNGVTEGCTGQIVGADLDWLVWSVAEFT